MINFLRSIFESLTSFFDQAQSIIEHIVNDIITFFGYLKIIPSLVGRLTDFIPVPYLFFVSITVTISIVYLIVGRSTGGD